MPVKLTAFLLSFLSFFAFWNPQAQPNNIPETRTAPFEGEVAPDRYDAWPTKDFESGKITPLVPALAQAHFYLRDFHADDTESLLILHKGKLVYEYYAEDWDKNTAHTMYSVTKSILSALVGIAIGEGKIKGVDQKVIDFYPDAVIAEGQEAKRDITIEHLLTMTSGLPGDGDKSDWEWWASDDTYKSAFETPLAAKPGEKFSYSSGPSCHTLAGVVSRAAEKSLYDYAKEKLFDPLGMTSVEWQKAEDGSYFGGYGISMTPRDMARFGYLYLNYGRWENTQILPVDWVTVTPPRSKAKAAYGYLFWNCHFLPFGSAYEANGYAGQFIEIIPALDMVIVRTADSSELHRFFGSLGEKLGIG